MRSLDSPILPPPCTEASLEGMLTGERRVTLLTCFYREDGTIDHSGSANRTGNGGGGAHRLGPKANQGAINAGLRALDRTGKPCRKWARGGFTMKTFTGVVWELPRWKAPPKVVEVKAEGNGTDSNSTSSKENKDNSQVDSDKSNSAAVDVEKTSTPSQPVDSPAPMAATAA